MKKGEIGFEYKMVNGIRKRFAYYKGLETKQGKAFIFTRYAKLRLPFITSGNRNKDKTLIRQTIADAGYTKEDLPLNCDIHHHPKGQYIEFVPREIHRAVHHIGVFGIYNQE